MPSAQLAAADLRSLCESVQAAQLNAARALLRDLAASVANAGDMLQNLPEDLRAGRADTYTRHIAYADPHGAFTVAYLCLLYTSPSPRDVEESRMPSSA